MGIQNLNFYLTVEHPCGYYDDRNSQNLIPDPKVPIRSTIFSQLAEHGFRRSGDYLYRPHCAGCQACIPVRIDVSQSTMRRNQKRCLKHNQDIEIRRMPARLTDEYFELYTRYLNSRHADSNMANPTEEEFQRFLFCNWSQTFFLEFRQGSRLVGVAVTDQLVHGLSAVYTFYDPELSPRSLGTFGIISQLDYCRRMHLPYLYLGYWIPHHPKMHYKNNFNAVQYYQHGQWLENIPAFIENN